MLKGLYQNYWRFGFRSRLYDLLTPRAYLDSIQTCVEFLELKEGELVLDAGCGSGLGILAIARQSPKVWYVGMDILEPGLRSGRKKASRSARNLKKFWVRSDLSQGSPFQDRTFQKILVHFSIYTLPLKVQRIRAWKNLFQVLSPGGTLVAANPSLEYNSRRIIEESLMSPELESSKLTAWMKRIIYFFTERLGLRHIESQLRKGQWHAYSEGELEKELSEAGFQVNHSQDVYAGSGCMVVGKKPWEKSFESGSDISQ